MKNKKITMIFLIIFIIILVGGYFIIKYLQNRGEETTVEEYVPEQEITEDQFRQTIVSLYFVDKETGSLAPEARLVDIKDIMNIPYEKLFEMLKEGPKNNKLDKIIPVDTKVLKAYREGDCLTFDLSKEFLNFEFNDEIKKNNLIYSIVNTLTELTEVNSIKFLIDGQFNENLKDTYIRKSLG